MDIFSATAAVLRRWYVALPILLLTVWFAVQQYQSVQPTYSTTAASVLLPPPPQPPNPLITDPADLETPLDPAISSLGSGSRLIRQLVEQNLENQVVRDRLQAAGATATYEVETDDDSPLIEYFVTGEDPDVTALTLEALMAETARVLTEVQQSVGATTDAVYRLQLAAPVLPPVEVAPERNRALIATIIGGGAVAYFLDLHVDAAVMARRSHRSRSAAAAGVPVTSDRRRGGRTAAEGATARATGPTTVARRSEDAARPADAVGTADRIGSGASTRD